VLLPKSAVGAVLPLAAAPYISDVRTFFAQVDARPPARLVPGDIFRPPRLA
jgi:hypothetical protein